MFSIFFCGDMEDVFFLIRFQPTSLSKIFVRKNVVFYPMSSNWVNFVEKSSIKKLILKNFNVVHFFLRKLRYFLKKASKFFVKLNSLTLFQVSAIF